MARPSRIDFPGAWHHVMNRGARRAPIFKRDDHCILFLDLLADVVHDFELEVHAFSLMPNHYHLLMRSQHGNLSRGMKQLGASYTQIVNLKEDWDGPVFKGRFRSQLIKDETHLAYLLAYIHLNPLKAGLVTRLISPQSWTSHRTYIGREEGPDWLTTNYFESVFEDSDALHQYVLDLHRGKRDWPEGMAKESGWLKQARDKKPGKSDTQASSRFMGAADVLKRVQCITGADIKELKNAKRGPRANPARRFGVWALRTATQMTQTEIGDILGMSTSQVAHVLRRLNVKDEPICTWIAKW